MNLNIDIKVDCGPTLVLYYLVVSLVTYQFQDQLKKVLRLLFFLSQIIFFISILTKESMDRSQGGFSVTRFDYNGT